VLIEADCASRASRFTSQALHLTSFVNLDRTRRQFQVSTVSGGEEETFVLILLHHSITVTHLWVVPRP